MSLEDRIQKAQRAAVESVARTLLEQFPEAKSSEVAPFAERNFRDAVLSFIDCWVAANVPQEIR